MATYNVYNNILIKLENVYLRVESEVDKEITSLLTENNKIAAQLSDLKGKIESLTSLKRTFELYSNQQQELLDLNRSLFNVLCDKQILLRFLQEKELLINGYLMSLSKSDFELPTIIQINKEFKLRKRLQEIELLSSFLIEDERFANFTAELEQANELFDVAIESGATDNLENVVTVFQNLFEKIVNIYDVDQELVEEFGDFKSQISLQVNSIPMFTPQEIANLKGFQKTFHDVHEQRVQLELEVDKLLYQFTIFQTGRKMIASEIKNVSGELESILFKEYAVKQKIQELKQYKIELNHQKESFMKDPTVDGYTEAVQQLESVESRFRRLMMHKNFEKQSLAARFFIANKTKVERSFKTMETPYNKILFQVLHNNHISGEDKLIILRLSKPSKLLNTQSGKFFFQRTGKTRSLRNLEKSFSKLVHQEIH